MKIENDEPARLVGEEIKAHLLDRVVGGAQNNGYAKMVDPTPPPPPAPTPQPVPPNDPGYFKLIGFDKSF